MWVGVGVGGLGCGCDCGRGTVNYYNTVDDISPALPITRNIAQFPKFRILKVMQDLYHQQ